MTSAYPQHQFITDWIDRASDELLDGAAVQRRARSAWTRFDRGKVRRTHADRRATAHPARVRRGTSLAGTPLLLVNRQRI